MDSEGEKRFDAIFKLLREQHETLNQHWPYTSEQIEKDKKLSAQIRELINEIQSLPARPTKAGEVRVARQKAGA